jgi:hypothetical protein
MPLIYKHFKGVIHLSKRRTNSRHLAAVETNNTLSFNQYVQQRKTVHLIPKSLNQEHYIELLTIRPNISSLPQALQALVRPCWPCWLVLKPLKKAK